MWFKFNVKNNGSAKATNVVGTIGFQSSGEEWVNSSLVLPKAENVIQVDEEVTKCYAVFSDYDYIPSNEFTINLSCDEEVSKEFNVKIDRSIENWGASVNFGSFSKPIRINGTKDTIYMVFQNSTPTMWESQIKAFDISTRTWTIPHTFYTARSTLENDIHYAPSIGLLPNGSLIVFWGYYTTLNYTISTNSALTSVNLTELITNFNPVQVVNGTDDSNDHCYPNPYFDEN